MSLTKEECEKALNDIKMLGGINIPVESLDTIEQLIKEHYNMINVDEFSKKCEKLYTNEDYFKFIILAITKYNDKDLQDKAIHCLSYLKQQLENPPLNFEELEPDMWIWDNKLKTYFLIKSIKPYSYWNIVVYANYLTDSFEEVHFEENRFYRYEVKNV